MLPPSERGGSSLGATLGNVAAGTAKKTSKPARRATSSNRATSQAGARRTKNTSSGRSSGGSSRRTSSGGGGGGNRNVNRNPAPAPKPKPAPKPPSLADYLGTDSAYQNALRGGKRSLADFLSELGRRRGEAGTQFTQTRASMERDREKQLADLRDEFASRGLIQSGLFGEEQGRFQEQFTNQINALQQQQAALLADLMGQETNYKRENELALEQARQEAIARRAAKYKIGA